MMDPTRSREVLSCSGIVLGDNPVVFQDWLLNLFNNLRGGHSFGSSTQVEKSSRLNLATQFLMVA